MVVSVDDHSCGCRLPPESSFPAQLDDCFDALGFFTLNAHKWDVDPPRIAVSGKITIEGVQNKCFKVKFEIPYCTYLNVICHCSVTFSTADCAGGHLAVALAIRWPDRVVYAQRYSFAAPDSALPQLSCRSLSIRCCSSRTCRPLLLFWTATASSSGNTHSRASGPSSRSGPSSAATCRL